MLVILSFITDFDFEEIRIDVLINGMNGDRRQDTFFDLIFPEIAGSKQNRIDIVVSNAISRILQSQRNEISAGFGWHVVSVTDKQTQFKQLEGF